MNRRAVATVVYRVWAIAIALGVFAAIHARLSDQVATHWGLGGTAEGFISMSVWPYFFDGFSVLMGGLVGVVAYAVRSSMVGLRFLQAMSPALVAIILSLGLILTTIQIDAIEAPTLPGWAIPLALVIARAGWGLAARVVGADDPVLVGNTPAPAGTARIEMAEGQTGVWSGRTPVVSVTPIIATVVVVLGLVPGWPVGWFILAILGPIAALLVGSSMYRITVGSNGLRVAGLAFGLPRVGVPLNRMDGAEAGTVDAWSFGGWGIRLGANGENAVIARPGPVPIVRRTDGVALRVSLDHPENAAAVFTTWMDRR